MQAPATELTPTAVEAIVEGLTQVQAETTVATMKAQNFHWNVTGMAFGSLHDLFGDIYEDHFEAQDDLAERVKALGGHAEGRLAALLERSKIAESDGRIPATEMVRALMQDQETLAATCAALAAAAGEHGDALTEDLAIQRGREHEKFAWMLRAHLEG